MKRFLFLTCLLMLLGGAVSAQVLIIDNTSCNDVELDFVEEGTTPCSGGNAGYAYAPASSIVTVPLTSPSLLFANVIEVSFGTFNYVQLHPNMMCGPTSIDVFNPFSCNGYPYTAQIRQFPGGYYLRVY